MPRPPSPPPERLSRFDELLVQGRPEQRSKLLLVPLGGVGSGDAAEAAVQRRHRQQCVHLKGTVWGASVVCVCKCS